MRQPFGESAGSVALVVGLGNPGEEYRGSRHNAGFMAIERLLEQLPSGRFVESHSAESRVWSGRFRGRPLYLQEPLTYMNLSGTAVAKLVNRLRLTPQDLLVVVDDMDLPVGRLRLRDRGSAGGHNGLKSLIAELGSEEFKRLRIGIGHPESKNTADYVLSGFSGAELDKFQAAISEAAEAVKMVLGSGIGRAMNRYNAPPPEEKLEKPENI